MGTRCVTRVFDEQDREILCLGTYAEGWPAVHGQRLALFLEELILVNGLSSSLEKLAEQDGKKLANRMGCVAAQLVTHFRSHDDSPGSHSIMAPGDCDDAEWSYEVRGRPAKSVKSRGRDMELRMDVPGGFLVLCAEAQPVLPGVVRRRERVRFEGALPDFSKWLEGQKDP